MWKKLFSLIIIFTFTSMLVSCNIPEDIIQFFMVQEVPVETIQAVDSFDLPENSIRTSMGDSGLSYKLEGDVLTVVGRAEDKEAQYALLAFTELEDVREITFISNGWFQILYTLPAEFEVLTAELYLGTSMYEEFESLLYDFVKLEKIDGIWDFADAPVLDENMEIYNQPKDLDKALQSTQNIPSTDSEIQQLSNEITQGCESDYEKVLKIHDWVAENIYYDMDAFYSGEYGSPKALDVLHEKCGVCEGYANLFAALVRAQSIPCRVQEGYALGIDESSDWSEESLNVKKGNHAWNEAYVNDRWMIIDTTWDSNNKVENGQWTKGKSINHLYFDAHMKFFSLSHRSMN